MLAKRILFAVGVIITAGCQLTTPPINVTIPANVNQTSTNNLSCALSLSQTAVSGQSIPITVNVSGGIAPFTVSGNVGTFLSSVAISRTYTNQTSGNVVIADTVTVVDSIGSQASCTLSVTVTPVSNGGGSGNALACSSAASTLNPAINQTVNFVSAVSGGTAPYTFTSFVAGNNGTTVTALSQTSSTTASASANYSASGLSTATFQVRDALGSFAACSNNLNVATAASVSLAALPSSSVNLGNAITLTATPANFATTPNYVFSTTTAGILISSVGAFATISTTDSVTPRSGTITVTATAGSQVATNSINVSFVANQALNCSITYPTGSYLVGTTVPFSVTATNGQMLTVTELNIQDGYLLDTFLSASPRVSFAASGIKTVSVQAKSASTGALCNSGALVQTSISIGANTTSTLACNLTISPNPSYTWQTPTASVSVTGASGSAWLSAISSNASAGMYEAGYRSTYSTILAFPNSGSWPVTATVTDSAGRTATCSTTQVVSTDYLSCYWNGWTYVCY